MKEATQIIIRPLLTEKNTFVQRHNQFVFEVAPDANKIEIRYAVETLGRCQVKAVNTVVVKGKTKRARRGATVKTPNWKKAFVTLREGESLSGVLGTAFEGV
jgi:large subunit ribosomal protein L23